MKLKNIMECIKEMPCSCRNDMDDFHLGKHIRMFSQKWSIVDFWPFKIYVWKCLNCEFIKPGINE